MGAVFSIKYMLCSCTELGSECYIERAATADEAAHSCTFRATGDLKWML